MTSTAVTDSTFDEQLAAASGTVLLEFWTEWCGPCTALSPIVEQIGTENADRLTVLTINPDENRALAERYRITSVPAIKILQGGEVVKTIFGAKPKPALERELAPYLAASSPTAASLA